MNNRNRFAKMSSWNRLLRRFRDDPFQRDVILMNTDNFRQTYALDGAGIDRLSEEIDSRLETIRLERENRLRIRLSMEEALLRMRDH